MTSDAAPAPGSLPGIEPHPAPLPGRGTGSAIWLIRHGEVAEEWHGVAYGNLDVPLSPAGLERTAELGESFGALPPDRVLASPLSRARQLGQAVAERAQVPLEIHPALAEIHRGTWQSIPVSELYARHPEDVADFYANPWEWRGHQGEADVDVYGRTAALVDELLAGAGAPGDPKTPHRPQRTLVLATHYNVVRVITAAAMGISPARSFSLRVDTGRAVKLVDGPSGFELHHTNVLAPGPAFDCDLMPTAEAPGSHARGAARSDRP